MNEKIKKNQKILLYGIGALIFIVVVTLISLSEVSKFKNQSHTYRVDLPLDDVDPKEIWVDQIRTENDMVQNKVKYIQELVVSRIKDEEISKSVTHDEIANLRNEIDLLKTELKKKQMEAPLPRQELKNELAQVSQSHSQNSWNPFSFSEDIIPNLQLNEICSPLTSVICPEPVNLMHVDRTIAAGTSVKAILLSSVDMPCGVKGSTDPLPIKLRIIDNARLPNQVRARLKGGIITASVYGDLSSERVYVRLEKLTQVRADGHFIETQVAGYVSGEDGKYGIRGTVVDKSCQLIENAMMSGFLSGVSNFFEAAAMTKLAPCGAMGASCVNSCDTMSWGQTAGQLGIAGGSQGVTNAMDALADYFIRRAEQLRPVIEIMPGRIVDITFLESADLGDLHTHEKIRKCEEKPLWE